MTIAKDFASKAAIAFVAVAMLFTMTVPSAKAQSSEDMQKMINDLLAQIAALQGQGGTSGSVASGICPFTWTRDLTAGATGADVMKLQQFLNSNADTRVSASGVGSVGMETEFYGPATAAAVSKFQVMHRADVLTPAGLTNPTGYFGPGTRAKANSLCTSAPVVDEDEDEEDEDSSELSGEADLTTVEISSADEDQIEEGAEDAPVAELTVEFEDGDASISRIDVSIASTSVDSWDVLETVSLWVDGDMVAEEDASDEDNYLDENDGTIRFSGLDIVAMEDEELDIVIAVTVQNNIDSDDLGTYTVSADAIRFFDADGVATTDDSTGDMGDTVDFTLEEAGFEDEIIVKTSTSDLDSATIQVEDDSKSDFETVFVFDIDTDDSMNDIELDTVVLTVNLSAAYNTVVDDAELVIDGVTIDDFTVGSTTAATTTLTFDVDGDVTVDAGDRVAAELKLRFKALAVEGTTVQATIADNAIDGEGADDVVSDGAATGDTHTLRTTGVETTMADSSAVVTSVDGDDNDYATFEIEIDVTAFEQDVYIPTNASTIAAIVSTSTGTTTVSVTLDSSAEEVNGRFEITEGSTETVTLRYTLVQAATGSNTTVGARLILQSLGFYELSSGGTLETQSTLPETDYRTSQVDIIN